MSEVNTGAAPETTATDTSAAPSGAVSVSGAAPETGTAPEAGQGSPQTGTEPAKGATLLEGGDADPGATEGSEGEPGNDWPADWRERLAGEDKAFLNVLKRYASPANYAKAGFEAQQKIRAGEYKKALDPKATPEQIAEWRKENGIPDSPEGYEVQPPNGYVFGETDAPVLDSFKATAHANNWTKDQLNQAVAWYVQEQEQIAARQFDLDEQARRDGEDRLRLEWGPEYRRNLNLINTFLTQPGTPAGLKERFLGARTADGRKFGNDPDMLAWLAQFALEARPELAVSVVPAGTTNPQKSIETEITEIEQLMATDQRAYWSDREKQNRYAELITIRERMRSRAA